jgi:hypothetical protein
MRSELLVQLNRERISIGNGHDGDQQAKKNCQQHRRHKPFTKSDLAVPSIG